MGRLYYERLKATYFDLLEQTDSEPLIDFADRSEGPVSDERLEDAITILRYRLNVARLGTHQANRRLVGVDPDYRPMARTVSRQRRRGLDGKKI